VDASERYGGAMVLLAFAIALAAMFLCGVRRAFWRTEEERRRDNGGA